MMGSHPWNTHAIPPHLSAELFPGLTYEEAVEDQETLYEALKIIASDQTAVASNSQSSSSGDESRISGNVDFDLHLQLALDEAMARSLQVLEDGIDIMSLSGAVHNSTENEGDTSAQASASASASSSATGQNDDEALPEMTYEELLSLGVGEAIGTESRGLSQSDINSLPTFKFKNGLFFKRGKPGECPICISGYRNNQHVTTLPCAHGYHTKCINRWLTENKNCPICQMEVNLSS